MRLSRAGWPGPLILATGLAGLCWLGYLGEGATPLLGDPGVHGGLRYVAWIVSGGATVLLGSKLLLGLLAGRSGSATGVQRVLVYLLLTFVASAAVLRALGFDPTAVLATSALLTAGVGFAMQPTLSNMFSGIALHVDRALRVGDAVLVNGQRWIVWSLSWRSVLARHSDGRQIVLPNAMLAATPLMVMPHDQPMRLECIVQGPAEVPPGQVGAWLKEAVAAFPQVDPARAITALPLEYDPVGGAMRYRVRFWVWAGGMAGDIEPEVVARAWYVFQRQGVVLPRAFGPRRASSQTGWGGLRRERVAGLIASVGQGGAGVGVGGEVLLFGPGERLVPPAWAAGHRLVLLEGEAVAASAAVEADAGERSNARALPGAAPSLEARRQMLIRELSQAIGPYAAFAVQRAGLEQQGLGAMRQALAEEVAAGPQRERFLDATRMVELAFVAPGTVLEMRRRGDGSWTALPELVARSEVMVLAVPRPGAG